MAGNHVRRALSVHVCKMAFQQQKPCGLLYSLSIIQTHWLGSFGCLGLIRGLLL